MCGRFRTWAYAVVFLWQEKINNKDQEITVMGDVHQMHVPVFINSSQVIHKEDTLCCYLVICKADKTFHTLTAGRKTGRQTPSKHQACTFGCRFFCGMIFPRQNGCKCGKKVISWFHNILSLQGGVRFPTGGKVRELLRQPNR